MITTLTLTGLQWDKVMKDSFYWGDSEAIYEIGFRANHMIPELISQHVIHT